MKHINGRYAKEPAAYRFWSKVLFTDGCWLWQAQKRKGYGQFWVDGRMAPAHRYAYEFCVGPIPEGLTIDHLCRAQACVLPDHLEPVTQRVNVLRGEGPTARHAQKTCCIRRHEYSEENTIRTKNGRECRACRRMRQRKVSLG